MFEKLTYLTGILGLFSIYAMAAVLRDGLLWVIGIALILVILFLRVKMQEINARHEYFFFVSLLFVWILSIAQMLL